MGSTERKGAIRGRGISGIIRVLAVGAILLSAGCDKAMESYNDGVELLAKRRYDEAVSTLDTALQQCRQKKGRDCSMFEKELDHARHVAGEHYYNLAQSDFVARRLNSAARHIARAVGYQPNNAAYLKLRERILEGTLAAEALRREALEFAGRQEWDAAIAALEKAIAECGDMGGAQRELDKIRKDAYNFYLAEARSLFENGQWDEAVVRANRALEYYGGGREAKGIIAEIGNRRKALGLIEQAKEMRGRNADPQAVLNTLEKARRLYPSHPEIERLIVEAKRTICDMKITQAKAALEGERLHEALRLLHESDRVLKGYGGVGRMMGEVTMRIAVRHTEVGDVFREGQKFGNAALHYLTAMSYRDGFAGARSGLRASIGPLRESTKYSIGYVGFNCAWQDRRASDAIEAGLLQHINRVRPGNIVIKDTPGFKAVLSGINVNIADVDVIDVRIEKSRPANTDALMLGQVLNRDIVVGEEVAYGHSKFQSGTKMEANPDYRKVRMRVDKLFHEHEDAVSVLEAAKVKAENARPRPGEEEDAYHDRRRKLRRAAVEAQKELDGLCVELEKGKERLAHVPPHIAIPIISEYEYPVVGVTRTGRISVFLKVVDSVTGAVLLAERVEGAFAASDSYVVGDPVHNVPGDPLELPDDAFIMKKATEQVLGKLRGLCDSYLANHSKRFVAMMNQAKGDGKEEEAVEFGMGYLITPGNAGADRNNVIGFLRAVAARRNEGAGPDLSRALGKYYRP